MSRPIDFTVERERHAGILGREDVLAELHRLTSGGSGTHDRGWVLVQAGPGMGKSAILAAFLIQLEQTDGPASRRVVPHHFIRHGVQDWDRPEVIAGSLTAHVGRIFPSQVDVDDRDTGSLPRLLARVSREKLAPDGERLVLVIDGLDETAVEASRQSAQKNPLTLFLPEPLPAGVFVVCGSRPFYPFLFWLEAKDNFTLIDLDDPRWKASNEAASHAFWDHCQYSFTPALTTEFIKAAVKRGARNMLYAVKLREWLVGRPEKDRRPELLPKGLKAFIAQMWDRLRGQDETMHDCVMEGLGILTVAREALTLSELGLVLGWPEFKRRDDFLRCARPFLLEESAYWRGEPAYRMYHESIRKFVSRELGDPTIRLCHKKLARTLGCWPTPSDTDDARRRYAVRHGLRHQIACHDWRASKSLCTDLTYLEAACRDSGPLAIESVLSKAGKRLATKSSDQDVTAIAAAVRAESHWLSVDPGAIGALLHNRLIDIGWSHDRVRKTLRPTVVGPLLRRAIRFGGEELRTLAGHTNVVTSVAISADGRSAISGSSDLTLNVWDLESGDSLNTLKGHKDWICSVAINADGKRAISGSYEGVIKVWDLENGHELLTLAGHISSVRAVAISADGWRAISGSSDCTVKVWDLKCGGMLRDLLGHTDSISSVSISADGRRAVSCSDHDGVKVWDLVQGGSQPISSVPTKQVGSVAINAEGRWAVSGSHDGSIKLWDLENGGDPRTIGGHTLYVGAVAISADGWRAVSGSNDHTVKVWDLKHGAAARTIGWHCDSVMSVAINANGKRAVSGGRDMCVKVWDLEKHGDQRNSSPHRGQPVAVAISTDGKRAASGSLNTPVQIWDLKNGAEPRILLGHKDSVVSVAISANGRRVALASHESLKVWDLKCEDQPFPTAWPMRSDGPAAISADGRWAVSRAFCELKVWDIDNGGAPSKLSGDRSVANSVAISAEGEWAVSGEYLKVRIWDLKSGGEPRVLIGHNGSIDAVAISPEGRYVLSGCDDGSVKVWDLEYGGTPCTLPGHSHRVNSVAISPDGRRAASASHDKSVRIWDLQSRACLYTIYGSAYFNSVAIAESTVIAGDWLGNVWILDLPADDATPPAFGRERRATPHIDEVGRKKTIKPKKEPASRPTHEIVRAGITLLTIPFHPSDKDAISLAKAYPLNEADNDAMETAKEELRFAGMDFHRLKELEPLIKQIFVFSSHEFRLLDAQAGFYRLCRLLALAANIEHCPFPNEIVQILKNPVMSEYIRRLRPLFASPHAMKTRGPKKVRDAAKETLEKTNAKSDPKEAQIKRWMNTVRKGYTRAYANIHPWQRRHRRANVSARPDDHNG